MTETALELVAQPVAPANLFGTTDSKAVIQEAAKVAGTMADIIRAKHLYKTIGDKNYVFVEGWTLLGSMLGVFPVCAWTRPLEGGGWEARVEARTLAGQIVGAAEAQCSRGEKAWALDPPLNKWGKKPEPRDDYALRSMAQTRATSKALRMPLGFILVLAGYEACPAEEMPSEDLTGALQASIAAVQAKKAAKIPPGTAIRVPPETMPYAEDYAAPPLCQCKSPIGMFASESKAQYGRRYWECQKRNDRVLELRERQPPLTNAQIMADAKVANHWRSWAEPWPRKVTEPRDGQT